MKHLIYSEKAANLPPNPVHVNDIIVIGQWGQTSNGQRLIIPGPANGNMLILATDSNIRTLAQCETWFIDGTFRCVPTLYKQLYTIHGTINGFSMPLVYALLQSKTVQTYELFFQRIINYGNILGVNLQPTNIKSDCEAGVIAAVNTSFPNANHQLCYFHFAQSNHRYAVTNCNLGVPYRINAEVRRLIRKFVKLAFLPIPAIRPAYNNLLNEILAVNVRVRPNLERFARYFYRQWISNPNLPIRMWNVHNVQTRTNNISEGWHSKWNKLIGKSHPNYYEFYLKLCMEQSNSERLLVLAEAMINPPARDRRYVRRDARINTLLERYRNPTVADIRNNNVMTSARLLNALTYII